ncbi:MAG: NADH:flavin oxidoreductase/NADH oxidase [Spirochaetes bacterium]|nr:NADH:flavin oxidoreductase/NADH oxidase [Spirochaetota bacterium]MBU1080791.1 NADH:flavin oxidoreductase/NADH oxidase [Spirochaetota bacterium]
MQTLYSRPLTLRGLELKNRIFMAPMCQYSARDGMPGAWHLRHYVERAIGGVALVVIEATAVSPEGRISPADLGLWSDEHRDAFAPLVAAIHEAGAKVAVQLAHAGRKASTAVPWLGKGLVPEADGGWEVIGPSAARFDDSYPMPREMGPGDIERVELAFAAAARRAVEAGFDAVELHAAHGYLVHQFLSPLSNRRADGYGGSLEGRSRLLREIAPAVRGVLPDSMPLLARVSATDWIEGGWDVEECSATLNAVKAAGVDFVDVSSGGLSPAAKMPVGPGYQVGLASRVRAATGLPTGAVGLLTTPEQIEQALVTGSADAVSLGRLLLRDPYWPARQLPAEARTPPAQYLRAFA